jgi:hypothetical protein
MKNPSNHNSVASKKEIDNAQTNNAAQAESEYYDEEEAEEDG